MSRSTLPAGILLATDKPASATTSSARGEREAAESGPEAPLHVLISGHEGVRNERVVRAAKALGGRLMGNAEFLGKLLGGYPAWDVEVAAFDRLYECLVLVVGKTKPALWTLVKVIEPLCGEGEPGLLAEVMGGA